MEKPLTKNIDFTRGPLSLKDYEKAGGYQSVKKVLKELESKQVQQIVKDSNLKGRGGAGFGTGMKWGFVPMGEDASKTKYLVCNADEMEPGTFKDRVLLEGNPHQLIEGMIVSAYAIQANAAYIFLRWAYKVSASLLEKSIAEAYEAGYLGKNILGSGYNLEMHLHTSVGRYMCGEETGLLNALEGKRAQPRAKPPFPQVSGLFGKPTIVNNVETLSCVPHIINNGAAWFKGLSLSDDSGTKIYGVSGKVKKPGTWELPMGGTMIILDDKTCPVGMVLNLQHFFAQESCGWCTPCREGLPWVEKTLRAIEEGNGKMEDLDTLSFHTHYLGPGNTFCALAPGAMEPLQSSLKYFKDDYEKHIKEQRCPWR
ncbi:MAG: NADH-ubiquinone oxidoreductase-F iron-sulfur binding region domain-containing protein [Ignavibacteriaceae bacterium]